MTGMAHMTHMGMLANDEQEIRNITWIAECIAQNQKDRIGNFISVF